MNKITLTNLLLAASLFVWSAAAALVILVMAGATTETEDLWLTLGLTMIGTSVMVWVLYRGIRDMPPLLSGTLDSLHDDPTMPELPDLRLTEAGPPAAIETPAPPRAARATPYPRPTPELADTLGQHLDITA